MHFSVKPVWGRVGVSQKVPKGDGGEGGVGLSRLFLCVLAETHFKNGETHFKNGEAHFIQLKNSFYAGFLLVLVNI